MVKQSDKNMTQSEIIIELPRNLATANASALAAAPRQRLIGVLEEISLIALLEYMVEQNHSTMDIVHRQFFDRFNIPNLKALPSDRFDDAVKYLVDQMPAEAIFAEG